VERLLQSQLLEEGGAGVGHHLKASGVEEGAGEHLKKVKAEAEELLTKVKVEAAGLLKKGEGAVAVHCSTMEGVTEVLVGDVIRQEGEVLDEQLMGVGVALALRVDFAGPAMEEEVGALMEPR
jgi:hypothetical protein